MATMPNSVHDLPDARTDAQFTMRTVLIAMAVVAVVASLAGPLVRQLSSDDQIRLLSAWAIWLAVSIVWIAYRARRRYTAEHMAGAAIARVEMFDEKVPTMSRGRRNFNIFGASLLALLILSSASLALLDTPPTTAGLNLSPHIFGTVLTTWWISKVVGMLWWRKNVRFGTNGVVWDQYVLLWDRVVECRWSEADSNLLELKGINQRNMDMRLRIPVPPEQRQQIQAILDSRKIGIACAPVRSLAYELGRTPFLDAIRHPQLLRFLSGAMFKVLLVVAVIYFLRSGYAGFSEFRGSILYGIVSVAVFKAARSRWASQDAGTLIVRLTGWNGWQNLLPAVVMAAASYFVGTELSQSYAWLAFPGGFSFGCALAMLYVAVLRPLDLRENGVVLQGNTTWPWTTVRLVQWNRDGNGRLVLGRGWRRVVTTAPREQRDAVSTLLEQKLPTKRIGATEHGKS